MDTTTQQNSNNTDTVVPGRKPTNKFGAMLREKGYTRITFGKKLKVAGPTVGYWSTNGVPESRIGQVAKALGVDPSTIPVQDRAKAYTEKHPEQASKKSKPTSRKPITVSVGRPSTTGVMFGDMMREAGFTASTFAKRMKITTNTAYSWSSLGVPHKRISKAAKVLGVDPSTIPVYVDPRSPRHNQPDSKTEVKPVGRQPNARPLTTGEALRMCEERYKADRLRIDAERVKADVKYAETVTAIKQSLEAVEDEYKASKNRIKNNLAEIDASYAAERGELVAALAKEIEAMRAVVDQYSVPPSQPVTLVTSVSQQASQPVQFGQPVNPLEDPQTSLF